MKAILIIIISIFTLYSNHSAAQSNEPKKIVTFTAAQNLKQKQETETSQQKIKSNSENKLSTIILVRHAEKGEDGTKDPSLSDKGKQRADLLAHFLKDVSIDSFYATPYKRAIETITPLAKANGKQVLAYNPTDRNSFSEMIQAGKGKKIVIAGHSNTVPPMVNALIGRNEFNNMDENDYGKIWFLVFRGNELIDYNVLNY